MARLVADRDCMWADLIYGADGCGFMPRRCKAYMSDGLGN
jgi:hypothetical protein